MRNKTRKKYEITGFYAIMTIILIVFTLLNPRHPLIFFNILTIPMGIFFTILFFYIENREIEQQTVIRDYTKEI